MIAPTVFNHIAKWSTIKIDGGVSGRDCFAFAMSWVKAAGGPDLTKWEYHNYREVRRLLRREGYPDLPAYVDTVLTPTTEPRDGDVVIVKSTDAFPAFGLWFDDRAWFATGKDSKIAGSKTDVIKAWTWQ